MIKHAQVVIAFQLSEHASQSKVLHLLCVLILLNLDTVSIKISDIDRRNIA